MKMARRVLLNEKARFLLAGASTTAFSYLLYLLLLLWWLPMYAYATSYVAGVAWSYSINSIWVFNGRWTWRGLAAYPIVYIVQGLLSLALFSLLVDLLKLPPTVAPLLVIVAMLPVTFMLGRRVVAATSAHSSATQERAT